MSKKQKEFLPVFFTVRAALAVCLIIFLVDIRINIAPALAKAVGLMFVVLGVTITLWAVYYLKKGFAGWLEPDSDSFVQAGPYCLVRHPGYLGLTLSLFGIAITMRSLFGILAVFTLYLPAAIYRARLEEEALQRKFGKEWLDYTSKTGFLLPKGKRWSR